MFFFLDFFLDFLDDEIDLGNLLFWGFNVLFSFFFLVLLFFFLLKFLLQEGLLKLTLTFNHKVMIFLFLKFHVDFSVLSLPLWIKPEVLWNYVVRMNLWKRLLKFIFFIHHFLELSLHVLEFFLLVFKIFGFEEQVWGVKSFKLWVQLHDGPFSKVDFLVEIMLVFQLLLNTEFLFVDFINFLFFFDFLFFDGLFHFFQLKLFKQGISQENIIDNLLIFLVELFILFVGIGNDFGVLFFLFNFADSIA